MAQSLLALQWQGLYLPVSAIDIIPGKDAAAVHEVDHENGVYDNGRRFPVVILGFTCVSHAFISFRLPEPVFTGAAMRKKRFACQLFGKRRKLSSIKEKMFSEERKRILSATIFRPPWSGRGQFVNGAARRGSRGKRGKDETER